MYPKDLHDEIYRHEGLVRDAWLLSLNFVTLLILHSIGSFGYLLTGTKRARLPPSHSRIVRP